MKQIENKRKEDLNFWLIKTRWVYASGIFVLDLIAKSLSFTNVNFHYWQMILIYLAFLASNAILWLILKFFKWNRKKGFLAFIGFLQILVDICFFVVIFHFEGGIESVAFIFFLLPIFYASLLFGMRGSLITALYIGIVVNLVVIFEYQGILTHINRHMETPPELNDLNLALTKTSVISVFYAIAAFFAGYFSMLISKREETIYDKMQDLKKEKDKISSIISNFVDPVLVVNPKNRLEYINPAARKELKIPKFAVKTKLNLQKSHSLDKFKDLFGEKIQVKEEKDFITGEKIEEVSIERDGEAKEYKVITAKIGGKKGKLGIMKIFYDITREKAMDKLKSEFVSVAAHQLRTPLSAIKWTLRSVIDEEDGKINKPQKDILLKSYESNQRIINLVNDLLNVLKIEEGRFGYTFTKTKVEDLIKESTEDFKRIIKKKGLNLKIEKPKRIGSFYIDKEKIMMVIQNLLDNAIKYSGNVENVYFRVKNQKNYLKFEIEDEGVGIPEKSRKNLFTKFFRASNVIKMETSGSGLGLYIAKNIIEKHKGKIAVESREGEGTKVYFTIKKDLYT
ncbi:MAG: sensor histidine kinase [Patescibacteria group bacterium]